MSSDLKQLNKLYSENKFVTIIPMGLGKSQQKMEMSINSKQPVISTFAEHWKTGRFSDSKWDKKIIVNITTLDELIKKFGNPKYIKIDVEGFEHEVILGLTKKSDIISFEFTSEFIDDAFKSIDYLISLGYLDFIKLVNPKRAFLTHISHHLGFHDAVEKTLPQNVKIAYDQLQISI